MRTICFFIDHSLKKHLQSLLNSFEILIVSTPTVSQTRIGGSLSEMSFCFRVILPPNSRSKLPLDGRPE
jgi:hypothetical protein